MAKRKNRELTRKSPKREAYKTVLIVCEGQKTEKLYFENLILKEKLSSVNIKVYSGNNSDPKSVVETAIQKREEQRQYLDFDEVFCVIDRDNHSTFNEAQKLAKVNNIQLIVSYPSFEYWYLCHFIASRAPIIGTGSKSAGDMCVDLLNIHWKKTFNEIYKKARPGIYTILLPYLNTAKKNAMNALIDSEINNEPNPSTRVHLLVENLINIRN
ncbi:Uncharacterised protein [Actinobacillus porcinus]|uniref:RloB-like protein n=1 Tax=Actinobacillus porcinus TaxID=51048 RepID=A0ABY6TKS1_9PAST|nr:RloB family protein [Actinobacillus porcinus]VFY92705.1 Uncharacterised protein [Actinobacillus porcinus]VTU06966.1 Uncharacterised protein [Actinobacillus porcinus]